jgi:predicted NBD/HSP70 family sugar kinase
VGHRQPTAGRVGGRVRRIDAEKSSLATILNLVRLGEAETRHAIEIRSELGRAVVADRLSSLTELGLVEERELGQASGGRAPRLCRFRAGRAVVLVGALDPASLSVGISDLSGRLLNEHHEPFDLAAGPAATLERLDTLFAWLLDQHRHDRELWSIALAVPGSTGGAEGDRFAWPAPHFLPAWNDYPLVEQLMLRRKAPVHVRSSVRMMALGELRAGSAVGEHDVIFVDLGKEISAAFFSEGRMHRGSEGAAGLIGHTSAGEDASLVCRCGNTGCLELFASADAIAREGARAAADGRSRYLADTLAANGEVTVSDIGIAAQLGDVMSAELLSRAGRLVGAVLAGLANAFNPSLIVLGGAVAQTGDILLAAIREAVYRRSHPLVTRDLRILRSHMASSAGLVGSAIASVDAIFEPSFLGSWINLGSPLAHPDTERLLASAGHGPSGASGKPQPPVRVAKGRI